MVTLMATTTRLPLAATLTAAQVAILTDPLLQALASLAALSAAPKLPGEEATAMETEDIETSPLNREGAVATGFLRHYCIWNE